jgi:Transport and Golgi organisation 2
MCTTVLSFDPGSPVPVLLIGVRDEFLDRAWVPPGRHWPQWPALVGGQDLQAGGTWLAVHPGAPRVACVLNGRGKSADEDSRLSRGDLPLLLAAGELDDSTALDALDLARYDPFHLLGATPDSAHLWSWDGERLSDQDLGPGLHLVVNSGLEAEDSQDGPGADQMRARVTHFRPLLAAAHRPQPRAGSAADAWEAWLALADGGGLSPADPRALLVRGSFDDREWGSSSISLVALANQGARYDFRATQSSQGAQSSPTWTTVLSPDAPASK